MKTTPIIVQRLPTDLHCLTLSTQGGVIYTTDHTVLHVHDNRRADCYILSCLQFKIQSARQDVSALTGIDIADVKYSYPAMARQVSAWLGVDERKSNNLRTDLIPVWHFQHCEPSLFPQQTIYDMRAAYWQIASRAPSLSCEVLPESERIVWLSTTKETERKWQAVKEILQPHKRLRLAIIGVNSVAGPGKEPKSCFIRGAKVPMAGTAPTWFNQLSLLTIRVAYELTQLQAMEVNTCYANADCVAVDTGVKPRYWEDYGIEYAEKGNGVLDARAVGVWKCGAERTDTYAYFDNCGINCLSMKIGYRYPRPVWHELYCKT